MGIKERKSKTKTKSKGKGKKKDELRLKRRLRSGSEIRENIEMRKDSRKGGEDKMDSLGACH